MSILIAVMMLAASDRNEDRTAVALERCLASPKADANPAPTETDGEQPVEDDAQPETVDQRPDGRSICFEAARRSYDRRIVVAYRSLMRKASPEDAEWLVQTSQAWLTYRSEIQDEREAVAAAQENALWIERLRKR